LIVKERSVGEEEENEEKDEGKREEEEADVGARGDTIGTMKGIWVKGKP